MKRFVSMTIGLALLIGAATANQLRLGDYCATNAACQSGCCWSGVCRASFADCSADAQEDYAKDYSRAIQDQLKTSLSQKIVAFAKQNSHKPTLATIDAKVRSFIAKDIKRFSLQAVEEPVTPAPEPVKNETEPVTPPVEPVKNETEPVTPVEPVKNETEPVEPVKNVTDPVTPPKNETSEGGIEGEIIKDKEQGEDVDFGNGDDTGVSGWIVFLITLASILIFIGGFIIVKKVFFKHDDDYTAARAVTA